jgi:hypothetical protein
VVLVPFRGDAGGWRDRNYAAVRPYLEDLPYHLEVGDSGASPFSISSTWNALAVSAGEWDLAVLHGADLWVDPARIVESVAMAARDPDVGMVYAFTHAWRLTRAETTRFHRGARKFSRVRTVGSFYGGVRVIRRALWEEAAGFDERFVGWGHEDRAFAHVTGILSSGHRRVHRGTMANLWHPRRHQTPDDPYFGHQAANYALYAEVLGIMDRPAMIDYLEHRP